MGGLRCVDGSCLEVTPVVCRDTVSVPYEITLDLTREGTPYGSVGERCGWFLARVAGDLAEARADGREWPHPEDGPLFSFRRRHRTAPDGGGELRCFTRTDAVWISGEGRGGRWHRTRRAIVEAWGQDGAGARAVLTSSQLAGFLEEVITEAEVLVGARFENPETVPVGGP